MSLLGQIGYYGAHRRLGRLAIRYLARPYRRGDMPRYAVLFEPNTISYAQVYPFVLYAQALEKRHNIQIRFFRADRLEAINFARFDRIILQLWFDRETAVFENVFEQAALNNVELIAFLDAFAHNDLRLASLLDDQIAFYFKKSLFKDFEQYRLPRCGDTNLTDHYNRAFGIEDTDRQWDIPKGFQDKLRLSPNFFTAPHLFHLFLNRPAGTMPPHARSIDLHARLGQKGTPWYSAMRQQAMAVVHSLEGVKVVSDGTVGQKQFNAELQTSRACFSPFGYGELCWRDIEAMAYGAVLLKPDMSHLTTLPDLYEAGVTYLPLAWDSSDLQEKTDWVLAHPDKASDITREAFRRVQTYLETDRFIDDMEPLFTS